jgi:hypothetical protein
MSEKRRQAPGLAEEDSPEARQGLEAQSAIETKGWQIPFHYRELNVLRTRFDGFVHHAQHTGTSVPLPALVGPAIDTLNQPAFRTLHIRVAHEDRLA